MSEKSKVYFRSREGLLPPPNARFALFPFSGAPVFPSEVVRSLPSPCAPIAVLHRVDRPNRSEWKQLVLRALQANELQKVVLARETTLTLGKAPDPWRLAAALGNTGAAIFCIQQNSHAFLGATPERLFQRTGRSILSESLAGTGAAFAEKELREHRFVQDYLEQTLSPFCIEPIASGLLGTHRTSTVQHLHQRLAGTLKSHVSDLELLRALHPTPALCGTPKQAAYRWLQTHEPFERSLYGGVIGWSTETASDWMVAIRCCVLEGTTARLYTGAGIVQGSNETAEWNELEDKLSLYKDILCGL